METNNYPGADLNLPSREEIAAWKRIVKRGAPHGDEDQRTCGDFRGFCDGCEAYDQALSLLVDAHETGGVVR